MIGASENSLLLYLKNAKLLDQVNLPHYEILNEQKSSLLAPIQFEIKT